MGDVVDLDVKTRLPIPIEKVLRGAKDLESVVVIGTDKDGNFHFASSDGTNMSVLWDLERAKQMLLFSPDRRD